MQPEPSTVSPKPTETSTQDDNNQSAQYGRHDHDAPVPATSADNAGAGSTTPPLTAAEQVARDAEFAASLQERHERGEVTRRLSPQRTPSPPSAGAGYNKITEYEQASTPPIRRREGPGFEVIKKVRSPNDTRSPLQDLPNGMVPCVELQWTRSCG